MKQHRRPIVEFPVEFRNRANRWLRGMMHFPQKPSARRRVPGVVFLHGFTGDRMESHWIFVKCARALARAGIASLRFDFAGSGESEGEFRDATLQGEISDARDAVEFFRRQKGIDRERLGLVGLSLGGCIAAVVAEPARARAAVLWSAVAHPALLRELARKLGRPIAGTSGGLEYDAREISPRFLERAARVEPAKALARFRGPVLIIHPGKDDAVPLSHAEDLFRAAGSTLKEKIIIPGADHTFTSVAWEDEVLARSVAFLRLHLLEN